MSEYTDIISDGGLDPRNAFDVRAAPTALEPVAIVGELYEQTRREVIAKGHTVGSYLYAAPPDAAALASVREALQFANATLRPLYSDPDGAEKELSTLRTQNAEQAERIRELERLVTSQGISSMEDLDENQQLRAALASARAKITAMEIDAEEVLDFDECTAMLLSMDSYHDLTEVGEALDAILSGQSVEDKGERK